MNPTLVLKNKKQLNWYFFKKNSLSIFICNFVNENSKSYNHVIFTNNIKNYNSNSKQIIMVYISIEPDCTHYAMYKFNRFCKTCVAAGCSV